MFSFSVSYNVRQHYVQRKWYTLPRNIYVLKVWIELEFSTCVVTGRLAMWVCQNVSIVQTLKVGFLSDFLISHHRLSKVRKIIHQVLTIALFGSWDGRKLRLPPGSLNYPGKCSKLIRKPCHISVFFIYLFIFITFWPVAPGDFLQGPSGLH